LLLDGVVLLFLNVVEFDFSDDILCDVAPWLALEVVVGAEQVIKVFFALQRSESSGSHTPGCDLAGPAGVAPVVQVQVGSPSSSPFVLPSPSESF